MTAEVALRHVGIVLGLEVSRVACNNADWYRLLGLCGKTDTLEALRVCLDFLLIGIDLLLIVGDLLFVGRSLHLIGSNLLELV
jgi:hypothetical protein